MEQPQAKKKPANRLLQGTLILTVAGLVVKGIGSLNWIILSRFLGGEGIGLYQMAFPIYLLALSVSSAGLPVAISILTAEKIALQDVAGRKRLFRTAMTILALTGLLFSWLTYLGSGWLIEARLIRDPRAYYALLALSPAIFLVTMEAGLRGYLQGWQQMTPTAVSQIAEQLLRVGAMLFFAIWLLPLGIDYAAGGASLGAGAGAGAGLLVLVYYYWRLERRPGANTQTPSRANASRQEPLRHLLQRMAKLALPVSLASIMLPLVANLDLLIVPARLETAGYTVAQATELFGYLTGMGVPLVNLATMMTAALATSIVPAVSAAAALGNLQEVRQRTATAMRLTNLVILPAAAALWVLAVPVATVVYHAPQAGEVIRVLAFGVYLLGVHQVTTGVLQGMGHSSLPVVNMGLAAIVKVILNYHLTALPALGICGAAWATNADLGLAALLNYYFVRRYTQVQTAAAGLGKNVFAALVMGVVLNFAYQLAQGFQLTPLEALLPLLLLAVTVYCAVLLLCGGLSRDDVVRLPLIGPRLLPLLAKHPATAGQEK